MDQLAGAIEKAGVPLVCLNFFAGDMPAGDRGIVSCLANRTEFKENIAPVVELGSRLGRRLLNAPYGNRLEKFCPEQQDETAIANIDRDCPRFG